MTAFNLLQLAVAAGAAWLIAQRSFVLLWRAPLSPLFRESLEAALVAGQLQLAERLSAACRPGWGAVLASAALEERREGRDPEPTARELCDDLTHQAARGLHAIVALGRIAMPLAFIGVIVEISEAFAGGSGLIALHKGLAASVGLERALTTFAIGFATTLVCLSAARLLGKKGRQLIRQLDDLTRVLENAASAQTGP